MPSSTRARNMGYSLGRPRAAVRFKIHPAAPAWERVMIRLMQKLPDKPSRATVFGRAGLRASKAEWMRRQPDLRSSVVVKLARALKVKPSVFFDMILKESKTDSMGEIHW